MRQLHALSARFTERQERDDARAGLAAAVIQSFLTGKFVHPLSYFRDVADAPTQPNPDEVWRKIMIQFGHPSLGHGNG